MQYPNYTSNVLYQFTILIYDSNICVNRSIVHTSVTSYLPCVNRHRNNDESS